MGITGGLQYSYNINHGSMFLSKYPMNRMTDMITNFGAVVIGCIVLKVWLMQWIMVIVATAVLGFLLINLPEAILSSENTPYEFTDCDYYEKYGEQYEQDNGYVYFVPEED